MILTIMDYDNHKRNVNIGKKDDIASISISVISGDEIAEVIYKDYTKKCFDSSDCRMYDFFDDEYTIYNFQEENNLIDNPLWQKRKSSYDDKWRRE